jgi:TetR/AcrR family transcriptional repressor of bet genes
MPKIVDHDLQRHAIASAALTVIDVAGLEGARLRDVAAAADVTTGAVTHYFDGKNALLEAAMDLIVARILEKQVTSYEGELMDALAQFLPIDGESRRDWRVWLAFWGRAISDEQLREKHRAYYAEITSRLAADLRGRDGDKRRLSAREARTLADAIVAAIDGIGTRATLEQEDWPPKRQRETLRLLLSPLLFGSHDGD